MEDWIGKTLSKVRIERLIGRGGMADVYLGKHVTLDRPMAIKILHAHMTEDPDLRRRFKEEAQAVAAMRHPNIVQVVDFDVHEDRPYIVMELLQGMPLASFLRGLHSLGHSLTFDAVAKLISGVASALDYAHQRGIVHRDVKPANILLREGETLLRPEIPLGADVQPILTDFGVARIATSTTRTASGTVLGTPAYMSPEQVMGEVADSRSDIYSMGIILYEMLAGRLPFDPDTDTPASILYKHVHESPDPLPNLPANIQSVVDRSLAKEKEARYQRAGDLARDLAQAVGFPASTTVVTSSKQTAPPGKDAATPGPIQASHPSRPVTPISSDATSVSAPATARTSGLSGVALAGAFGLGAAVLAGGAFLGVTILRGVLGSPASTTTPEPIVAAAAILPTEPPAAGATETIVPLAPTPAPTVDIATVRGIVLIRDASLDISIQEVPPPDEGMEYHVWFSGQDLSVPLHLVPEDEVSSTDGRLLVAHTYAGEEAILGRQDAMLITLDSQGATLFDPENVVYKAEMDAEVAAGLRLIREIHRGEPVLSNLLNWTQRQSIHFASHAGFSVDSLAGDSLPGGRLHAEHTINIAEGKQSDLFRDWDENGDTQNPGDDVGLLNYLLVLQAAAEGFSAAQQQAGRVDELPDRIAQETAALIERVIDVRDAARQVAGSDELAVIRELGLEAELGQAQDIKTDIETLILEAEALELTLILEVFAFTPGSS